MLRALLALTVLSATAYADDEDLGNCKEEAYSPNRIAPLRTDAIARDAKGRIVKKTTTLSTGTQLVQTYDYDAAGKLTVIHVPGSGTIAYDYDDKGRVAKMRELDEAGQVTRRWERRYDDKGRLARELAEQQGKVVIDKQYTYDDKGRVAKLSMDKGATTETMSYDDKGRLAKMDALISGATIAYTYKYDARGRRIEQANPHGKIVYSYDCK